MQRSSSRSADGLPLKHSPERSPTRIASWRRPAGPTRSAPARAGCRPRTRRLHARVVDTRAVDVPAHPRVPFRRSAGSAGERAGTRGTRSGACADSSTCSSAESASGAAGGTRRHPLVGDGAGLLACRGVRAGPAAPARAEMRVPGRAWLQFEVEGDAHRSTIRQTAIFDPVGLAGLAYWHGLRPLHNLRLPRDARGDREAGGRVSQLCRGRSDEGAGGGGGGGSLAAFSSAFSLRTSSRACRRV